MDNKNKSIGEYVSNYLSNLKSTSASKSAKVAGAGAIFLSSCVPMQYVSEFQQNEELSFSGIMWFDETLPNGETISLPKKIEFFESEDGRLNHLIIKTKDTVANGYKILGKEKEFIDDEANNSNMYDSSVDSIFVTDSRGKSSAYSMQFLKDKDPRNYNDQNRIYNNAVRQIMRNYNPSIRRENLSERNYILK
ncbi:MAG: hypothetical protein WC758_03760 [Candidatus Woesearchaeota archaeon]|jgi:hypothetical protein